MWDDYHTGIRSVEDIRTWDEVMQLDDERAGQFVWGDFSREDAENALKENSVTVYSSNPIENGKIKTIVIDGVEVDVETWQPVINEPNLTDTSGANTYLAKDADEQPFMHTDEHTRVENIAEKLGMKLQWSSKMGAEGLYSKGVVYLNPHCEHPKLMIFKHEFTHYLENSPWYNSFVKYLKSTQVYQDWIAENHGGEVAYTEELTKKYAAAGLELDVTHEIVANFVAERVLGGKGGFVRDAYGRSVSSDPVIVKALTEFAETHAHWYDGIVTIVKDIAAKLKGLYYKKSKKDAKPQSESQELDEIYRRLVQLKDTVNTKKAAQNEAGQFMSGEKQYDPETATLKEQIVNSQELLNNMSPIKSIIITDFDFKNKDMAKKWVNDKLKQWGGQIDRMNFGKIYFSKTDIDYAIEHLKDKYQQAAFCMLPYVLKRGVVIGEHNDHKKRGKHTITFAAPITINGTTGNMGVIVNIHGNHAYAARVLLPDGSAFVFSEQTKETPQGMHQGVLKNESLADTTSDVSKTIISKPNSNVKKKQFDIIQATNPMWDDYHTGIRSVEDIRTWEEVLQLDDEREGQFVWGDFSREDAENALKENSVTVYSSNPIENGKIKTIVIDGVEVDVETWQPVINEPNLTDTSGPNTYLAEDADKQPFMHTDEHTRVENIAEKLGMKLQWSSKMGAEGLYSKGVVYLNPHCEHPKLMIFKHEFTHYLENSPWYNSFVKYLKSTQVYQDWIAENHGGEAAYTEELTKKYATAGLELDVTHEIVANFVAERVLGGKGGFVRDAYGRSVSSDPVIVKALTEFAETHAHWYDGIVTIVKDIAAKLKGLYYKKSKKDANPQSESQELDEIYRRLVQLKDTVNTKKAAQADGQYLFKGYANDGKGKYQSNFPKGTPKAAKAERILNYIQNVWSKRPIDLKIVENGKTKTIQAQFDPTYDSAEGQHTDASKLMGGNRHGTSSEQRVTLDLADDYYKIASEATYNYSKDETGKDNPTHKDVKQWHYFINDIYFAEYGSEEYLPYRVTVNVKEKPDGNYVYSFSAEKQIESSTPRTLHAVVSDELNSSPMLDSKTIISKTDPNVNKNSSANTDNETDTKSIPTQTGQAYVSTSRHTDLHEQYKAGKITLEEYQAEVDARDKAQAAEIRKLRQQKKKASL